MFLSNKKTYEARNVVRRYASVTQLQEPEKTILELIKSRLKDMRMLDIGVGGGRTTHHFAGLVKEYVGTDYSENMINACRKQFPSAGQNVSFKVCDVRDMQIFVDNYFDFILFSFNGIDCVAHEDRLRAMEEIKRVGKSGGVYCFSTHNLQSADTLYSFKPSVNPRKMLWAILRHLLLRLLNKSFKELKNGRYAIIRDGSQIFRLSLYYIKPEEQIEQLRDLGFSNIQVFSLSTGKEITNKSQLAAVTDSWLYYICNIP